MTEDKRLRQATNKSTFIRAVQTGFIYTLQKTFENVNVSLFRSIIFCSLISCAVQMNRIVHLAKPIPNRRFIRRRIDIPDSP